MKEAGRRCQRCGFAWYAMPPKGSPGKPRWFDETGSFWTDGQARMARRTSNYERHLTDKDRWEQCPNCGSRSVKTDNSPDFRPTGAITPSGPPTGPPPTSGPPSPPGPAPSSGASIWQRLGEFHGKHWRIIWAVIFAVAPFGSLGDETTYTGSAGENILKFFGILFACWVAAGFFFILFLRHRREAEKEKK